MTSAKVLIAGGAAAALVGGGLIVTAAPASACPYGTVPTHFDGVCVSGHSGGGSAPVGQLGGAPVASGGGADFGGGPNELPTVNGIPCTPEKIGTCIGLAQSQG